jgi:SAM-dependent methyltransferase
MSIIAFLRKVRNRCVQLLGNIFWRPHTRLEVVINDFAEFSGIPIRSIRKRIADFHHLTASEWGAVDAVSFSERASIYYELSQNFVYGILSANSSPDGVIKKLNRFNPRILEMISQHPGRRFFEFGGGVGVFCEIVARMGKDVHYMDVPGVTFDFAQWRFKKYGLNVTATKADSEKVCIPDKFDIVYTDAVIEHLPEALQIEATRAIAAAVDSNGLLVFLVDLSGPTKDDPMHHEVDISRLHEELIASGLQCEDGFHTFCSIWCRPTRVSSSFSGS